MDSWAYYYQRGWNITLITTRFLAPLEYLKIQHKSQWGLGTEEEEGYRTGPLGYKAGGIHSFESILGPHIRLKIRALGYIGWRNKSLGIDFLAS